MDIFDILSIVCGLALFLYGMSEMSDGLKRFAGSRLTDFIDKMISKPILGFLLGAGVTAVVQSSSATTVMIVGFVSSGIMTLRQSISVTMGANVGAVVTYWLTALSAAGGKTSVSAFQWLKPDAWMPILALVGAAIRLFVKTGKKRDFATILLGFSVLMVGMDLMSGGASVLAQDESFTAILTVFNNPLLGFALGILITAAVQSSAASVGILQSLTVTGAVSVGTAVPIVLGQNIGTCITALLACVGTSKDAKRSAFIHLYFNVIGGLLFLGAYCLLSSLVDIEYFNTPINAWGVAGMHTVLKIAYVIVLAPFSRYMEKLAVLTVRKGAENENTALNLSARFMNNPAIAVSNAVESVRSMVETSFRAVKNSIALLTEFDADAIQDIKADENKVDVFEDEIGTYLVKLSGYHLGIVDSQEVTKLIHIISDVERISDHAVNLAFSVDEVKRRDIMFSAAAESEILCLSEAVLEILDLTYRTFTENNLEIAMKVEALATVISDMNKQIKENHTQRVEEKICKIENGFFISEILTNMKRISGHCSNIAGCILEIARNELDMHRYITTVKHDSESFKQVCSDYRAKYFYVLHY